MLRPDSQRSRSDLERNLCKSDEVVSTRLSFVCPFADLAVLGALGGALAAQVRPGDVVLLIGDLGAGKTTFTKFVAAALGVDHEVTSPTFTIAHGYDTASTNAPILMHLDAYRLGGVDDLEAVGLYEALDDGAVALIEWGDIVASGFDDTLTIQFDHVDESTRSVALSCDDHGTWVSRITTLALAIGAQTC